MKRSLWLILLVVGCGKVAAPETAETEKPPTVVETGAVSRGPMEEALTVPGSFVAADGSVARLAAAVAGRWQTISVREGDHVRAGQILAVVDTRALAAGAAAAKAATRVAESGAEQSRLESQAVATEQAASLAEAEAALRQAELERAASIEDAMNSVNSAEAELARVKASARPQEIAQARQVVVQAEVASNQARAERNRVAALAKEGYVSSRQQEESESALATAMSSLESAKAALSLLEADARPEDVRIAELAIRKAKQSVISAKTVGEAKVRQALAARERARAGRISLRAKESEVRAAQENVGLRASEATVAEIGASSASLRAPFSGRVVRRNGNPGDSADLAVPVLEIVADGATADFTASVSPARASRISAGLESAAVGQGSAGVEGRVISVGSADAVSGFVAIRIRGRAVHGQPRIGEFGTATVVVRRVVDAIRVPKAAVFEKEGASQCFVVVDGKAVLRKVQVSFGDDQFVRVLSGVKPGDSVITLGQFEMEDGAPVKMAKEKAP
jgi:HlyD family secretion protein